METPQCPQCGGEMKLVPAGTSKTTGKHYNEFYACKKWECKGTLKMEQANYRPTKEAMAERKEMFNVIDHNSDNISKHQSRKEESMTTLAINRDATLITVACLQNSPMMMATDDERQEYIKKELKYWKEYLQTNIYGVPF